MGQPTEIYVEVVNQKTKGFASVRLSNIASVTCNERPGSILECRIVLIEPANTAITLTHEMAEGWLESYKRARELTGVITSTTKR